MSSIRFLAAGLALSGAAAFADGHAASPFAEGVLEYGETYLASTLLGTRVHATEDTIAVGASLAAGTVAEWDDIGEIGDLVIGLDGSLQSVVIDVGGFLGIGEREVAVNWSALVPVREDDDPDEWFLGLNVTQEMLEAAPELVRDPAS